VIERLRKAVVALNALQHQGLIDAYAIGGGMAVNFYTDPQSTYDLDVFILRKDREKVRRLLEEASLDRRALEALLKRHDLYETFKRWELQNRD